MIHANDYLARVVSCLSYPFLDAALVTHIDSMWDTGIYSVLRQLYLAWFTRLIGRSRAVIEPFSNRRGGLPTKVTVIHPGIELTPFDDRLGSSSSLESSFSDDLLKIAIVGKLDTKVKGQDYLLRAFKKIKTVCDRRLQCVIVGEGMDEQPLRQLTNNLGIQRHVIFTGYIRDIATLLSTIDILVCSSLRAVRPLVVLESMAMGLSVIGTDTGGIPELIVDGETGYLVPPGDVHPLAQSLEKLISDQTLRDHMGIK